LNETARLLIFVLALAFDVLVGEPPVKIHPVVWIGKLISYLKARTGPTPTKITGLIIASIVILSTVIAGHLLVWLAGPLGILMAAYLLKSTIAVRCLLETSSAIGKAIDTDMKVAKGMLTALVGRNTSDLTRAQAVSSVIESLYENYVDSILTPILFYLAFQPLGIGMEAALAFKAISTMDSMLGYKTKGLKEIGYVPAHLDDLANFIPARLSIFFIALANPKRALAALNTAFEYHSATPSPNSGWPMSVAAGSLDLRLEKPGFYVLHARGNNPDTSDVPRAIRLMISTLTLTVAAALVILAL
jgi:adenosylcobinamide-phosphate synthase